MFIHKGEEIILNIILILYLNDNFEGGRFITQGEIRMKPKRGMLTIFDGRKMYHGVAPVTKGSRFALNFWWKK